MGLRCDYRVTQQSLLGMAAGVLLSIVLLGAVVATVAIRRFKALLMEARADQTRSRWGARGRWWCWGGRDWAPGRPWMEGCSCCEADSLGVLGEAISSSSGPARGCLGAAQPIRGQGEPGLGGAAGSGSG